MFKVEIFTTCAVWGTLSQEINIKVVPRRLCPWKPPQPQGRIFSGGIYHQPGLHRAPAVDRILTCPRLSISNVYTQLLPAIQSYTNLHATGKRCCSCNQDLTQLTVRKGYYPGWTLNQGSPYRRMGFFLENGIQRERDSMHEKFSIAGFEEEGHMARNGGSL